MESGMPEFRDQNTVMKPSFSPGGGCGFGGRGGFDDRGGGQGGRRGGGFRGRGGGRGQGGGFQSGGNRGQGGGRGGKRGNQSGKNVMVEPHRHEGVFICRGKEDALVTKNLIPGESVYEEKSLFQKEMTNPGRCRPDPHQAGLGVGGKVLYLGAASGTAVSHISDIVGRDGLVWSMQLSSPLLWPWPHQREDARHLHKYRMLISTVDVIFADVAQPDQTQSVALNAHIFLQNGGHFVISIKANGIDSTASAEAVFASEVRKVQQEHEAPGATNAGAF